MYARDNLITFDIECFRNYFLLALKQLNTGKVIRIEMRGESAVLTKQQRRQARGLLTKYVSFGFNSNNYDIPMAMLAIGGRNCSELKDASDRIINKRMPNWMSFRYWDMQPSQHWRTFDIMEPAPAVMVSLKLYGGRLHSKKLQDLPYPHDKVLDDDEMDHLSDYCINDLDTNIDLYNDIENRIDLRASMSDEYHINMMSKSDAQMAEAIFKHELAKHGVKARRPAPKAPNFKMRYRAPDYIKFQSMELKMMVADMENEDFKLSDAHKVTLPTWLQKTPIHIGESTYKIGIGGLHSQEKSTYHLQKKGYILADRDVASFYPRIILSLGLFPPHLTDRFLKVYDDIVERRLKAKAAGDDLTASSLKISINGSFGKLGSHYSSLFSPAQMLAVTLTGQLALIMLIERLEEAGIGVVSANTDGFVSMIPVHLYELYDDICFEWELDTGFDLEETRYKALYSRDVNSYLAVKLDGSAKGKGIFADPSVTKNPVANICIDAVKAYLLHQIPIKKTIRKCKDIRKFITVRTVTGGGVWRGDYLGKVVRWVYAVDGESIHYLKNGNKVATSDGAWPLMELPDSLPSNLDQEKYMQMAEKILKTLGIIIDRR